MAELALRLTDGTVLALPASLSAMTTYIILEQEAWFEKEPAFLMRWLKPGMSAIDIGANHGVYCVPMARRVAPQGQVFAYEPASEPRGFLEKSRELNRTVNLTVAAAALSDGVRQGHLVLGASSELNSLEGTGPGETVAITCLDAEDAARSWPMMDFVKIDAEGEEERILAGGASFLARHSPLVMFEVKTGSEINESLRTAFLPLGYRVYRLLAGAPVLVPDNPGKPLDGYEINLFAAKPDRAAALARDGLLVDAIPEWSPDAAARGAALDLLRAQPFAASMRFGPGAALDPDYRDGLAGYAAWRTPQLPLGARCGALAFAVRALLRICEHAATPPRLSTLARVAFEAGERSICVNALNKFVDIVGRGDNRLGEPFWPTAPRFDAMAPGAMLPKWIVVAALEQLERTSNFSSIFGKSGADLGWLGSQEFASREIERRHVLSRARAGERVEVPARLRAAAPDHVNADVWRAGLVPNTFV
jgi:FkbM family methyltransferase